MLLAVLAAIFWLPSPWGVIAVAAAVVLDLAELAVGFWYTRRRRPQTGAEALPGAIGRVVSRCDPVGRVRLAGELWQARSEVTVEPGDEVRVLRVDGELTLHVEPADRG